MQTLLSFEQVTEALLKGKPSSYIPPILQKASELNVELVPEASNMLDGILCQFNFVILSTTKTLRNIPSCEDYTYVLNIMGFSSLLIQDSSKPEYPDIFAMFSSLTKSFVKKILTHCAGQECMVVEEISIMRILSLSDVHGAIRACFANTFLFDNSEFRKTHSAYIGPWKLHNGGKGNCLFYSLRQLITIWKILRKIDNGSQPGEFFYSLWPQKPVQNGSFQTYFPSQQEFLKAEDKMEKDAEKLRRESADFFLRDLNAPMPGNHKVSYEDSQKQIIERELTRGDFIYMAKEGDLKLQPEFTEQRNEWARLWCRKAKENGEWGCMRMITGFSHLITEPRTIALYFFNVNERERTRTLERTDDQCIQPPGAPDIISKENDAILKLPTKRLEDEISFSPSTLPLKSLTIEIAESSPEEWNAPRAPLQRHCALYHERKVHWCVLISALQMQELRRFTNIDTFASPLF